MTLRSETVDAQYARSTGDPLRVLVIGAGIAGIAVAQMLRRDGRHPVLIERSGHERPPGYMIALMPMVDSLMRDLGVRPSYLEQSVELGRYRTRSHTGRALRTDSMGDILDRFGDYRCISRGPLLDVLANHGCDVAFETTVTALDERPGTVAVTLSAAGVERTYDFDLVIVADGLRSTTRDLIAGSGPIDVVDTGWSGWVVWADADDATDLAEEVWGAGFFLGTYPVKGRTGVILCGPDEDLRAGPRAFAEAARRALRASSPRIDDALDAVAAASDPYCWRLDDARTARWATARTVLLGDAAAGFLPTAGIGAGMALESAWVLARMLRHASTEHDLERLLAEYEAAQRPRVHAAQRNSRDLARLMFNRSRTLAVARETAMRLLSVEAAIRPIRRLLQAPPDPDRLAAQFSGASVVERATPQGSR